MLEEEPALGGDAWLVRVCGGVRRGLEFALSDVDDDLEGAEASPGELERAMPAGTVPFWRMDALHVWDARPGTKSIDASKVDANFLDGEPLVVYSLDLLGRCLTATAQPDEGQLGRAPI